MSRRPGHLHKKRGRGKFYIYLRESFRNGDKVENINIYSFGKMPGALEFLYSIREDYSLFPEELLKKGYNLDDLDEWIMTLETQVTGTGREFKLTN